MNDVYRIHPEDSVAVALHPLAPGDTAQGNGFSVSVREAIPDGHKIALCRMESGKSVLKYGWRPRDCRRAWTGCLPSSTPAAAPSSGTI